MFAHRLPSKSVVLLLLLLTLALTKDVFFEQRARHHDISKDVAKATATSSSASSSSSAVNQNTSSSSSAQLNGTNSTKNGTSSSNSSGSKNTTTNSSSSSSSSSGPKNSTNGSSNSTNGSKSTIGPLTSASCQYPIWRLKNQSSLNLTAIIAANKTYNDSTFNSTSTDTLYYKSYNQGILSSVASKFTWARARSVLKNTTIFGGSFPQFSSQSGASPVDARAGLYGDDSYFLAALTAISMSSSVDMTQIIATQNYTSIGIFAARVMIKGIPTLVTVDDYLPFNKTNLAFAQQSKNGALWAPFLEKVWAKASGNYESISGSGNVYGDPSEAFDFLIGSPTQYVQLQEEYYLDSGLKQEGDDYWGPQGGAMIKPVLQNAFANGQPMVAVYNGYDYTTWTEETASVAILGIYTINSEQDGSELDTLLLLSNPAGVDIQFYQWFDGDQWNWTPSALAQVPFYSNNTNDGLFYVSLNDFSDYFSYIQVAKTEKGFFNNYQEVLNDDGNGKAFAFNVTKPGKIYIGLEYYNPRMYPVGCHDETWGQITLLTPQGTIISSTYTDDTMTYNYLEFDFLAAGPYIVIVQNTFDTNDVKDYTVRVYSNSQINITQWDSTQYSAFNQMLIKKALASQGQAIDYLTSTDEFYFSTYVGSGVSFTYFEVDAGSISVSLNLTFYVGNSTYIQSGNNSVCGGMRTSQTWGNYFTCSCNLPAYTWSSPNNTSNSTNSSSSASSISSHAQFTPAGSKQLEAFGDRWNSKTTGREATSSSFASTSSSSNSTIIIPTPIIYQPAYCNFGWEGSHTQYSYSYN